MKIFAGSPKDMEDVAGILNVSSDKIDFILLKKIATGYGRSSVSKLNKILENKNK